MDLPEITEAERLALRPGEVLVLHLDRDPSGAEVEAIKDELARMLGSPGKALLLGPGTEITVVSPEPGDP